jgi:hypothetical protein
MTCDPDRRASRPPSVSSYVVFAVAIRRALHQLRVRCRRNLDDHDARVGTRRQGGES